MGKRGIIPCTSATVANGLKGSGDMPRKAVSTAPESPIPVAPPSGTRLADREEFFREVLAIGESRRALMRELRDALEAGDNEDALRLARYLVGL